jgi:hypothetical protein
MVDPRFYCKSRIALGDEKVCRSATLSGWISAEAVFTIEVMTLFNA